MNNRICCLLAAFLVFLVPVAWATSLTNWVSSAVAPGQGSGTEQDPYGSIYQAITELNRATATDDVVILKSGTYDLSKCYPSGTDVIAVDQRTNSSVLEIRSESGRPEDVTIDCHRLSFLDVAANKSLVLRGLTIADAYTSTRKAAAVFGEHTGTGHHDVYDCVFTNILSTTVAANNDYAGALTVGGNSVISGCRFVDCVTSNETGKAWGGAISTWSQNVTIRDTLFRRCKAYSGDDSGAKGGAIYHIGSNVTISNTVFDSCVTACRGLNKKYVCASAAFLCASTVRACYFTNCVARSTGYGSWAGALYGSFSVGGNTTKAVDCTFVDCASDAEAGCVTYVNAENCLFENNTRSAKYGIGSYSNYRNCLFRRNVCPWFFLQTADNYNPGYVISNCVFDANSYVPAKGGAGMFFFTSAKGVQHLVADCLFLTNNCSSAYLYMQDATARADAYDMMIRNCCFVATNGNPIVGYYTSGGAVGNRYSSTLENCSIFHSKAAYDPIFTQNYQDHIALKNCICINPAASQYSHNMLRPAATCATLGLATNCVFSLSDGVNLDAQYGNRVLTEEEMKLGSDRRPLRNSPLVNTGSPVTWCTKASRRNGPWDIGDGTYSAPKAATITLFGKSYDVGVKLMLNNRQPRLSGSTIDVGSGECLLTKGFTIIMD